MSQAGASYRRRKIDSFTPLLCIRISSFTSPLLSKPKTLRFGVQTFEQNGGKVEKIFGIFRREVSSVCPVVTVFLDARRQLTQTFWQMLVVEKPGKPQSEVSPRGTV